MTLAVAVAEPGRIELIDVEQGPVRDDEVAGKTLFSLISPGTELAVFRNAPVAEELVTAGGAASPYPVVQGYAAVFRVEEIGSEVASLQPGDLAYCMGPHQSRQQLRVDMTMPVPQGLSADLAVYARLAGVSMTTLTTTVVRPPGPVLVLGLGLVGILAAQVFAAAGYSVVGWDPSRRRRTLARCLGVSNVVEELPEASALSLRTEEHGLAEATAGFGLVLYCSGSEDVVSVGCRLVRPGGEVVLVATPWVQKGSTSAFDLLREIFFRYAIVRSGWEWQIPIQARDWQAGSMFQNQALAMSWIQAGHLEVGKLGTPASPRRAQTAYDELLGRKGAPTRVFDWCDVDPD